MKRNNTYIIIIIAILYSSALLAQQPNILIIHTDQQSQWTVSAYGNPIVATPNIDRLATEGTMLTNFMTHSAVCTPSRGSMLTGRYPNANGAYANNLNMFEDEITFGHRLRDAGYTTGYSGKLHLNGGSKPGWGQEGWSGAPQNDRGFTDNRFMFNRGHWKKIEEVEGATPLMSGMGDENTYTSDWLTSKTIDFINDHKDEPFCYLVSIPDPHSAFSVRAPYDTQYDVNSMTLPSNYNNLDGQEVRTGDQLTQFADGVKRNKAQYCGMVKLIDDCTGLILDCLEVNGILDSTIIIYTSDHGEYMGEHGLYAKNKLWETAYKLPFLIRYPEKIPAGKVVSNMVGMVDLHPTIIELANLEVDDVVQGHSFLKLLTSNDDNWEDEVFIYHSGNQATGIFTPEYEYAITQPGVKLNDVPTIMLFDRINDPDQINNLAYNPDYEEIMKALRKKIIDHHKALKTPFYSWLRVIEEDDNILLKNKGWHKHSIIIGN